jgi:signal transduction histidine kinase
VHQVVLNLVSNAIDAVPRGAGIINVRTAFDAPQRELVISVADNGPGVPADLRSKIFEPFYSSKGHGGTGLGLAVARKIVGEMSGTVELIDPPDGGAEFRVRLPAAQREPGSPADTFGPAA